MGNRTHHSRTRPAAILITLLTSTTAAVLLGACGPSAHQGAPLTPVTPTPPPPAPAPVPTAPQNSTPLYPSIGNHLGDPHRIGPDDLQLAVDSAQSAVSGSRLISAQPATAAGRPVWNVRLLTDGPSLKQVEVDAIVRGAKATDLQAPSATLAQTVLVENAVKTSWSDAIDMLQRRNPGGTVAGVVLDTSTLTPAWKITLLRGTKQTVYTVDAATGTLMSTLPGPRPRSDYR